MNLEERPNIRQTRILAGQTISPLLRYTSPIQPLDENQQAHHRLPQTMVVPFTYHAKAQSTFKPPLIANENAFLGDVISRYGN